FFFFFQAEDGIRDFHVTGVQTCALPIYYAWPTAEIAVMGAKGATEILYRSELNDPEKIAARTKEYEDRFANPFVAAERGFIDEVIMPHSSRRRIARAFAMLRTKKQDTHWRKHDTMPL